MAKLGFLGLGMMGYPMARNLLRAGHEVALWSNQGEKARKLADAEKGRCCATPKEVAENADCVFLCVGNTQMARAVILGPDGIGNWGPRHPGDGRESARAHARALWSPMPAPRRRTLAITRWWPATRWTGRSR